MTRYPTREEIARFESAIDDAMEGAPHVIESVLKWPEEEREMLYEELKDYGHVELDPLREAVLSSIWRAGEETDSAPATRETDENVAPAKRPEEES